MRKSAFALLLVVVGLAARPLYAQETRDFTLIGGDLQKKVNGALVLMAYSVVPDLAGSSLSINNASSGNPSIFFTQFGGGSRLGDAFSLYVEGSLGFSRYDPV